MWPTAIWNYADGHDAWAHPKVENSDAREVASLVQLPGGPLVHAWVRHDGGLMVSAQGMPPIYAGMAPSVRTCEVRLAVLHDADRILDLMKARMA